MSGAFGFFPYGAMDYKAAQASELPRLDVLRGRLEMEGQA